MRSRRVVNPFGRSRSLIASDFGGHKRSSELSLRMVDRSSLGIACQQPAVRLTADSEQGVLST